MRYNVTLLRAKFDENKDVKDLRVAKQLYEDGENFLFKSMHPIPKKFPHSPGGVAYGRVVKVPDWLLDYWDPIEKAAYPKYFALREKRKKEYLEMWDKKHGRPEPVER
ncbi:hypothetical protein HAZT_HAZT001333 [Hyalella azteca]|uniref:NADH dehydrogenase [ubiquinone] 1 beta subcomplex subunit 9 n=1 Tax=Hyalella azteca TaxID=294128 RepID=A0A6A0H688_HYAAZ|nr:hypothetical protein HAZT_HAZT001333 [Hyalella azteca]